MMDQLTHSVQQVLELLGNLLTGTANWIFHNVAATVALLIAVFSEHLKRLFWHPKLDVQCACAPPDCLKTSMTIPGVPPRVVSRPCYYFRIRVGNIGCSSAENVEVIMEELYEKRANGQFEKRQDFQALNLLWAHYGKPQFDAIPPGIYRHCDLGHVELSLNPRPQAQQSERQLETFDFDFVVHPNTGQSQIRPGTYRLRIAAVASNARIVRRTVELVFSGQWHNDEATMFRDGVSLRLV